LWRWGHQIEFHRFLPASLYAFPQLLHPRRLHAEDHVVYQLGVILLHDPGDLLVFVEVQEPCAVLAPGTAALVGERMGVQRTAAVRVAANPNLLVKCSWIAANCRFAPSTPRHSPAKGCVPMNS
jgi:hypothetical protein